MQINFTISVSQTIQTKFLCPTDQRGARIKAWCDRGQLTIAYPYTKSGGDCHAKAVKALIDVFLREDEANYKTPPDKNPWAGKWAGGQLPGNGGYVFVNMGKE